MSAHAHSVPRAAPEVVRQLLWFAALCGVAFAVPYVGISVFDLQHDVFYLVYFLITIAAVGMYLRVERLEVPELLRQRWSWSLAIGVVVAAFLVFNVFKTSEATPRPHGAYFIFELLWRGVGYGVPDSSARPFLPGLVAYRLRPAETVPATVNPVGGRGRRRGRWSSGGGILVACACSQPSSGGASSARTRPYGSSSGIARSFVPSRRDRAYVKMT